MQQSENQSQHSYDSSGDIISGVASTSNITPRAIGPFTQSPSSRFSGPFNPSPPSGDYVSSQVRKIERANDSVRREKLRFDREAVLELESQAPTSQAPTQPVFTSPRNSKKSVQIRDDMEDIQARERDQLAPRHRLYDDDEAEIIAGAKPTAGLTSSERNIERAVLFLENYLVDKDFQSIYEYLMNPNIPIDEVEKIANKLSNLYPQSYDEYVEYVSSTDRARQSAEKKATKGKHDIPSERKIHLSVETLLPQLRKKDYGSIYTYFRDADLTAHEVRKIANALNHIEPDLYSEYIDFMAENEIESPGSKQRTKAEAKSDESPDKKINDIVAVLLPVLKNDDFELLYTYLNSPNLTAEESQSIYKKLMSLDPVKFSQFILFAEDYEKQLEKKDGSNDIKIRTLKVDLTKWYNSSNFTAFNAWRDANIKSEAQESAILETLSASPLNSYKANYGKMYVELMTGKSKTFRAGTGKRK
jgi:ABC-type Zn uptake system ZnuABC Zn-binding protein ZnuA